MTGICEEAPSLPWGPSEEQERLGFGRIHLLSGLEQPIPSLPLSGLPNTLYPSPQQEVPELSSCF